MDEYNQSIVNKSTSFSPKKYGGKNFCHYNFLSSDNHEN